MNGTIYQIVLVVKNQQKALEFYTEKIGFVKKTDFTPPQGNRWVTVGPKEQDLEIALFEEGTPDANGWSKEWKAGNKPPITMRVKDCKAEFKELKSKGVRFFQDEPDDYPWGISATFSDPDGNLFSINQLPQAFDWK